jgi:hypothetical protein
MLNKCPPKPDRMDGSLESEKMLDSWLAFRESAAAQLLFSDCLRKFDSSSKRNAIIGMFGANTIIKNPTVYTQPKVKQSGTKETAVKKQVQTTMSSFLLDSMLVGSIKKQERATATAAKKKIKELSEK